MNAKPLNPGFPYFEDYRERFLYVFNKTRDDISAKKISFKYKTIRERARLYAYEKCMSVAYADHVSAKVASHLIQHHDLNRGKVAPKKDRLRRREEEDTLLRSITPLFAGEAHITSSAAIDKMNASSSEFARSRSTNFRLIQGNFETDTFRSSFAAITDPLVRALVIGIRMALKPENAGTFRLQDILPYVDLFYSTPSLRALQFGDTNTDPRTVVLSIALLRLTDLPRGITMRGMVCGDKVRLAYRGEAPNTMIQKVDKTIEGKIFSFFPWWYYAADLDFDELFVTAVAHIAEGDPLCYDYEIVADAVQDPSAAERVKTTIRKGYTSEIDAFENYMKRTMNRSEPNNKDKYRLFFHSINRIRFFNQSCPVIDASHKGRLRYVLDSLIQYFSTDWRLHPLARLSNLKIPAAFEEMEAVTVGTWPNGLRVWRRARAEYPDDDQFDDATDEQPIEAENSIFEEEDEEIDRDGYIWPPEEDD